MQFKLSHYPKERICRSPDGFCYAVPMIRPWDITNFPFDIDAIELRAQDQVGVTEYVTSGERAPLPHKPVPFFSGRDTELLAFGEALGRLAEGPAANQTCLFQGPPGAGKSALLAQCVEAVRQRAKARRRERWVMVRTAPGHFSHASALAQLVDAAVRRSSFRFWETPQLHADPAQGVGADRFQVTEVDAGINKLGVRMERVPGAPADAPFVIASRDMRGRWRRRRIVLFVDEAQNIAGSRCREAETVSALHDGVPEVPIMLAAYGLSRTRRRLGEAGVSRLDRRRDFDLAGMSPEEACLAIGRCFKAFGIHGRSREEWALALARRCQGWPQHLSSYLVPATEALDATRGNADRADLEIVLAEGDAGRDAYYARRIERLEEFRGWENAMADSLAAAPDKCLNAEQLHQAMAQRLAKAQPDAAFDAFLTQAAHAGLLVPHPQLNGLHIPIPTFEAYLRDRMPRAGHGGLGALVRRSAVTPKPSPTADT